MSIRKIAVARIDGAEHVCLWADERTGDVELEAQLVMYALSKGLDLVEVDDGTLEITEVEDWEEAECARCKRLHRQPDPLEAP